MDKMGGLGKEDVYDWKCKIEIDNRLMVRLFEVMLGVCNEDVCDVDSEGRRLNDFEGKTLVSVEVNCREGELGSNEILSKKINKSIRLRR